MTPRPSSRPITIALLASLAVIAASCTQPPGDQAADFRATVVARPAERGRIERTLVTTGTLRARASAKAVTEAGGKLTVARNPRAGRRWAIGDEVRAGELLAIIAPDELATTARLEARRRSLETARADHARYASLFEQGLLSSLQMAEQDMRLSNAEADLQAAELQQSKSQLVSPIGGVLASVTTSPDGELVTERATIAEVMEFGELIVDLDLGASDILDVVPGQKVRVTVPGTNLSVEGQVARVAPAIDPRTRTFRVEAVVPNADGRVRPGMFVRSEIVLEAREDVLLVPAEAVVVRDGVPIVFAVEAQRALRRVITPGLVSEHAVEVRDGLGDGQLVVVTGQETLDDGVKVVVRE